MKNPIIVIALVLCCAVAMFAQSEGSGQRDGIVYVPNADVAIRIAEAVLEPIYGDKAIAQQRPFRAELVGNEWIVEGSRKHSLRVGGTIVIRIARTDARILGHLREK